MTTNSKGAGGAPKILDAESEAIVYQGITLSQATTIFAMDLRDIKAKIHGRVMPCGKRRGFDIYHIRELAPYLVAPPYDIDEFIQRMSIADLPPILRKEYWAGLRSRQLFEKEAAELWPTSQVVDMVSSLFKTIRMSMLLTRESVERETELTERQRAIITRIIDNALEDTYAKTISEFSKSKTRAGTAELRHDEEPDSEDL